MAYPVYGSLLHQEFASGTSWAVTATPDHLVDDVMVAVVHVDGANYTTGATGWTAIGTRTGTPTAGTNMQAFYKVAASSGTGDAPTFAISGSDDGFVSMFLIRDCDTAAVVNVVSSQTDWNLANTAESATPTTTADGCLLVYLWSSDGNVLMRTDLSDASMMGTYRHLGTGAVSGVISYRQQEAAGAAPAVTMMTTSAAEGGTSWVIGFNNKTGGRLSPDVRSTITKVNEYGGVGPAVTWYGPNQTGNAFAGGITSLNSITLQTAAASASEGTTYDILTTTTTDNRLDGGWHSISSTDMDGKLFSFETQTSRIGVVYGGRIGAEGVLVGFTDGTNYEFHRALSSIATFSSLTWYRSTVACGVTTPAYSSGTLDWTAITGICYLLHHLNTSADTLWVKDAYLVDSLAVTGGNAANPSSFRDFGLALIGHPSIDLVKLQGGSQTLSYFNIQIGDGANTTVFDASASPVSYPQEWANVSNTTKQALWNVPANVVSVNVKASASDVINLTATSIYASVKQAFTIDAASSASADYSTLGLAIIGFDVTDNLGLAWNGATFSDCGTVTLAGGGDMTNCTIASTTSANAAMAITANGSTLDGTTIDVTGTSAAYHLELGTAVTAITLTDVTFTGTPGTDKVHVLKASGTVTITISGTTSLAAGDVTTAGATVVIAAPSPTLDATVFSGSRVVLYNDTTAAELDNTAPAGTSWSKVITSGASSGDTLTLHVFKEGYEEFSTSFIYAGIDNTLLVTQSVHAAIASLRTELSITDYTTITEFALDITGTVEIDADDADGNTMKARLAIWYNGVLTTENGARYLRGAISVLSTAAIRINVSVLDLLVANVSVTYGLNFTDTDRRLYRSDGTAIYAAASAPGSIQNDYSGVPDTVETGVSGLTGSESAQLMGLPSATTIAAAVWAYVITGSTTAVQMMRGFAAMLLGKVSGAGTGAETFRDIADTKDVATFTVDSSGNRTAVTRDLT